MKICLCESNDCNILFSRLQTSIAFKQALKVQLITFLSHLKKTIAFLSRLAHQRLAYVFFTVNAYEFFSDDPLQLYRKNKASSKTSCIVGAFQGVTRISGNSRAILKFPENLPRQLYSSVRSHPIGSDLNWSLPGHCVPGIAVDQRSSSVCYLR